MKQAQAGKRSTMKVNVNFVVSILDAIYHTTNEYDENWEDLSNGILNQLFANRDEVSTWEMNDYLLTEFSPEDLQQAMNYLGLGFE
jgi:hypothetical protein